MKSRTGALRKAATDTEQALWKHLRGRQMKGYKFRRQAQIGPYIADFASFEAKLVVELDGGQHLDSTSYDDRRTTWLGSQGFHVARFWNNEVLGSVEDVKRAIWELLPPPRPSPTKGGRVERRKRRGPD